MEETLVTWFNKYLKVLSWRQNTLRSLEMANFEFLMFKRLQGKLKQLIKCGNTGLDAVTQLRTVGKCMVRKQKSCGNQN